MDRLEQRRPGARRVEVGRRGSPDPAGDRATEVGDDVAEHVVGDDHVVATRVLHEVDARGVDVVVHGGDVGVLERHLVERALPEVAGEREHVGLVHEREVLARTRPGEVERVADAALDAHAGVHRALRGDLVRRALAQEPALARVHAFGVLADDDEVDVGVAGVGRGDERALVHVEVELEAQPQQDPALDDPAALAGGGAHRAEEHGVELADRLEVLVGEDRAVALVALPAEVERVGS